MEERSNHIAVVIGASRVAEDLRRAFIHRGIPHSGIGGHTRGLRRMLVMGDREQFVLCIALDRITLSRHGEAIRTLLADQRCFPADIRSIGLIGDSNLTGAAAELGCDVYVHDSAQALRAVRMLSSGRSRISGGRFNRFRSENAQGVFQGPNARARGGARKSRRDDVPQWQRKAKGTN